MVAGTSINSIYHEHQVRELCALHALNNLFQERGYTKQELDQICYNLSPDNWINPHKSMLGFGNYDINVIMAALQRKNHEAVWFDKRRDPNCLQLDNIEGFILNVPTEYKFGFVQLPYKRRHWIAVKKIEDAYYNLDSKLDSPQLIGKDSDLLTFLKEQIESKEKELFIIVSQEIENSQKWLTENDNNPTEKIREPINNDKQAVLRKVSEEDKMFNVSLENQLTEQDNDFENERL